MEKITLRKIEIFEWYDGVVRGVGHSKDNSYLIVLVSWNRRLGKLYALLEISEPAEQEMRGALNGPQSKVTKWDLFNSAFDRYVRSYQGEVHLVNGELTTDRVFVAIRVENKCVGKLGEYEFENTMNEANVNSWTNLINEK